jgi:hypothetical protein
MPLGQAVVVPDGATMVVCEGGGGSLLLKLKHPPSRSSKSRGNWRMGGILISRLLVPTVDAVPELHSLCITSLGIGLRSSDATWTDCLCLERLP